MKLSSLLNPKLIKCSLAAKTKDEALDEMLEVMAAGTPGVSVAELKAALSEREKLGPFSMAKGSAFPHARTEKVSEFRVAVGTAPHGLDFKAPDGNLIRLIVLFVIPKKHSNLYLTTLAQFLNLFGSEENLLKAAQASCGEDLVTCVDTLCVRPAAAPLTSGLATVTPQTPLSKAVELFSATRAEAVPVVDIDGNFVGELTAASLLQLGVREHFLHLTTAATLQASGSIETVLRSHADAPLESLGVLSSNGYRTVQEDEPLIEMAVKLCHAGARGAYVLRGRRLVGSVTTGEILKKIAGGKVMAGPANEAPGVKLYNAGAEHFKRKEFDQAIDCFKRASEADPKLYRAWAYLGMAYAQQGQLDPAIEAYRKCIDIAPDYHKAFNNVGELYRRKGLLDYAAMVFKMATEIDPKMSHYFYNLGITYFEIGMYGQAEEAFRNAVALDGNDYEYATELAQVQFTQKNYEAALNTLSKFHDAHPEHTRAAETGARVQMLRRRLEALKAASPAAEGAKSEVRRVSVDEEDENAKTKVTEPIKPDLPTSRHTDPPQPPA